MARGHYRQRRYPDHRFGFAGVFNHHQNIAAEHFATWGNPLEILTEFGLGLKPYPACGAAHPPIEAAVRLRGRIAGGLKAIRRVRVGVTDMHFEPMVCDRATTPLEGKFCMGYCIAAALLDGDVTLGTFTDAALARINASGLPEKVTMELDDRVVSNSEFGAVVDRDRRRADARKSSCAGHRQAERWFPKDRLPQVRLLRHDDRSRPGGEIFALAQSLDQAPSLRDLTNALGRVVAKRP
jgi:2-methylcitrate dehydratase PrpD